MARVYESRTNRALVHNYFIARKYCVLSRYVANNYINVFPANTFFNGAYQTISDIQFIATGRVASVTGYKYIYIYICLWSKKKFESYSRDPLTFSNVDSRTCLRIYRLALLLRAPETLSKSRISIFNAHHTLLVRKMTSHNSIGKYRHLVN